MTLSYIVNDLELSAVGSLTLSAQAPVGTVSSTMSGRGAVSGTRSCVMASDVNVRIKLNTIHSSADGSGERKSDIRHRTSASDSVNTHTVRRGETNEPFYRSHSALPSRQDSLVLHGTLSNLLRSRHCNTHKGITKRTQTKSRTSVLG